MEEKQDQKKGNKVEEENEKNKGNSKQQETFSPSSSPTHEFSFTISLHQSKSPPSISALDLSPADEIFFHGHLLPLRLLSHLPLSPLSPIRSKEFDTFILPIKEEEKITKTSPRVKSKSFSFFGLQPRRRKGSTEVREKEEREKKRRKLGFNMSHVIKRYMRIIRPLLFIRGKKENIELRRKPHSFSGYFSPKKRREMRERGGGFSAPVSTWTSPRNSGKLVANGSNTSAKSDSSMEELQDAIQAAIAHCKKSIVINEKTRS